MRAWFLRSVLGFGGLVGALSGCAGDSFEEGDKATGGSAGSASGAAGASGSGASGSGGSAGGGKGGSAGAPAGSGGASGAGASGASGQGGSAGSSGSAGSGGSAGSAGSGGDAGAAGSAGAGGEGGGGAGGGGTCPGQAPTAQGATLATKVSAQINLTVAASDPESGPLTYSWKLKSGGDLPPTLDDDKAQSPVATPKGCGVFTFEVTVSDACSQTATAEVTLTVSGDGPNVSNTLCKVGPELHCGTVEQPWCEVGEALGKGSLKLKVHGSDKSYSGDFTLLDGAEVVGGYGADFSTSAPDPLTNKTRFEVASKDGLQWASGAQATLQSVRVVQTKDLSLTQTSVQIPADAKATLNNILVDTTGDWLASSDAVGVLVTTASGPAGTVSITGSSIQSPKSKVRSRGLWVVPGAKVALTLSSTKILGSDALDSTALILEGGQSLDVTGGLINGGHGATSSGLLAQGQDLIKLVDAVVQADGVTPDGILPQNTASLALRAVGVTKVEVHGGSFLGKATGTSDTQAAVGIQVQGQAGHASRLVLDKGAQVEGGLKGLFRLGVQLLAASGDLQDSTLVGSTHPGGLEAYGVQAQAVLDNKGAVVVPFPSDEVTITSNKVIAGGNPETLIGSDATIGYRAAGISIGSSVGPSAVVKIKNNDVVTGCADGCSGPGGGTFSDKSRPAFAAGVEVQQGTAEIRGNQLIHGGPWVPRTTEPKHNAFTAHIGVLASPPGGCLTEEENLCPSGAQGQAGPEVSLIDNTLVLGSGAFDKNGKLIVPGSAPGYAYALQAIFANLTVDAETASLRGRFLGGWTDRMAVFGGSKQGGSFGAYVLGNAGKPVALRRARFSGGASDLDVFAGGVTYGAVIFGSEGAKVERNWVEACGLDETIANSCRSGASYGLVSLANDGGTIVNNYAFSGYAAGNSACVVARTGVSKKPAEVFAYNLCLAQSNNIFSTDTSALDLISLGASPPDGLYVVNNTLGVLAGGTGNNYPQGRYHVRELFPPTLLKATITSNVFLDLTDEQANDFGTQKDYSNAGVALYLHNTIAGYKELDSMDQVNALTGTLAQQAFTNKLVSTNKLFNSLKLSFLTPDDVHLANAEVCKQMNGVVPTADITNDYDGDPRANTGANPAEIGPDECK